MNISNSRSTHYWAKIPSGFPWAVIVLVPDSNTNNYQIQGQYKYSKTWDAAERKAAEFVVSFSHYTDSEVLIINSDTFNRIVDSRKNYKSEKSRNEFITQLINESQGNNMTLALEDQTSNAVKYLVYCLSDRQFVGAFDTSEQALSNAQDRSRSNPTKRYMVAAPSKLVYQPINVTVQDIDLSVPAEIA